MGKFKTQIDFSAQALEAARNRVLDSTEQRSASEVTSAAKNFLVNSYSVFNTPLLEPGLPWDSKYEQYYLKQLKYYVNLQNLKSNKVEDLASKCIKENFANLREIQRELVSLLSETTEEETKLLGGYSKVHYNAFVRGIDAPLQWKDLSGLRDFKTGFAFKEKNLMAPLQNAGLALPIRDQFEVPILDAYIIDESTDVGDTMHPIQSSPAKNLIRKNKVFNHVVVRKEHDHSSRKYKTQTSYSQYPYNCISTLTIELEMPSMVQVNYLTFEPAGGSTIYVPENGLSYKSEDGSEISLSTLTIPGEVSTTLIFQPIHTKYIRIKFEQYGTLGRKDVVLGDKKIMAFNNLLASTEMNVRYPSHEDHIKGRVYDFSLANVSVGLYAFEPKGIFRSGTSLSVDSPLGFDFRWEAEQLIPFESFDTYLRSAILPEGRTLLESYLHLKLYGGKEKGASVAPIYTGGKKRKKQDLLRDTLLVDSLVPVPDSYPIQVEYMDFVQDKAKAKLFPDVKVKNKSRVTDICLLKYDISNLSGGAATTAAFGFDLPPEKVKAFYQAVGLDSSGISQTLISPEDIPGDRAYNESISEHKLAKAAYIKAIKEMIAVKRDNLQKDLIIIFEPPSDEDIAFVMGDLWHRATEDLKEMIRLKPEDYLLLSEGVLYGSSRKIQNKPITGLKFYARTHVYSNEINAIRTPIGQALMNTKLIELSIDSFDGSSDIDVVTVSMSAVKSLLKKEDAAISHLSSKDRALIERYSEINFYGNEYRREVVKTFLEPVFPDSVAFPFYEESAANGSLWSRLEPFWYRHVVSIQRHTPTLEKVKVPVNILGGLSGGDGFVYKQSHGQSGSTLLNPVKHCYENPKQLIDPDDINIGDKSEAGTLSKSELTKTYHIDDWYYDFAAVAVNAQSGLEATNERISHKVQNWFKHLPSKTLEHDINVLKTNASDIHDYQYFNYSWLRTSDVLRVDSGGDIDLITGEMSKHSFEFMKDFFRQKTSVLVWKFSVDGGHDLGIGDIVGFKTKPYGTLDGQYYVVGIEKDAFYVKAFNQIDKLKAFDGLIRYSPNMVGIAPSACDQSSWYPEMDFSITDYSAPLLGADGRADILVGPSTSDVGDLCPENYIKDSESPGAEDEEVFCIWDESENPLPLVIHSPFSPQLFGSGLPNWINGKAFSNINDYAFSKYQITSHGELNFILAEVFQTVEDALTIWKADFLDQYPNDFALADNVQACCPGINLSEINMLAFNSGFIEAPIEVYENNCLLTIGEDYDISLNSGSDWLGCFPLDSSYEFLMRQAKAGNFIIRVRSPRPSSVYWMSYRVASDQELSEKGRIFLKNGRITCDRTTATSSGKIDAIIIARTRTANPYLTPLLRNYSLRVQENQEALRESGKLKKKHVNLISKMSTVDVS